VSRIAKIAGRKPAGEDREMLTQEKKLTGCGETRRRKGFGVKSRTLPIIFVLPLIVEHCGAVQTNAPTENGSARQAPLLHGSNPEQFALHALMVAP
jgi:hypothetical protein